MPGPPQGGRADRKYLLTRLGHAAIAEIHMERRPGKVTVTVHTGRPGVVIGKKGTEVDKLRDELAQLTGKEAAINVEEIKRPETSAQLVADNIAHQLQQRISFRRAMKRRDPERDAMGAQGIKVRRRAGWAARRSRGPRATTRAGCRCTPAADIDYATQHREDDLRHHRVKVWIFKGEVVEDLSGKTYSTGA